MAKLIELQDAAEMLGISPEQLTDMRSRNEIFGYRDGSTWKFKVEEIDARQDGTWRRVRSKSDEDELGGDLDELVDVGDLALDDDRPGNRSGFRQ